jgi:membrane protease YdiL (CAAX protease family)
MMQVSALLISGPRRAALLALGTIPVPSRLSGFDATLVLLAATILTGFPFARLLGPWEASLLLAIAALGWLRRARPVMNLGAFGALLVGTASLDRLMHLWPLPLFVATAGLLLLVRPAMRENGALPFLQWGSLDRQTHLLIVGSAVVAGTALVGWFVLVKPDYSAIRAELFPSVPTPLLFLGVVLFSAVNGALEELAYRGVLLDSLDAALGAAVAPVVIQALAFGALHIGGFPRGAAGVVLATIFGVMMGTIRRQTRGLLAPWLAHILADITIGAILIATR